MAHLLTSSQLFHTRLLGRPLADTAAHSSLAKVAATVAAILAPPCRHPPLYRTND